MGVRVAVFSDGIFPFAMGGMQKHTTNLVKHLAQKGVNITLFSFLPEGYSSKLPDIFTAYELQFIRVIPVEYPHSSKFPGHYIRESYQYSKNIFSAFTELDYNEFDFIYAQGFTAWYLLKHKKKCPGLPPTGINFHGLEMFQMAFGLKNRMQQQLFRPFVKDCIKRSDVYFSLGARLSKIVRQFAPLVRIAEIPVAVDESWLNQPLKTSNGSMVKSLVFVGRYERRKGIEELIDALNTIDNPFKVHFIGAIPANISKALKDKAHTIFHGAIYDEGRIKQILAESDVLVCPSYAEGMPTVIIEGMASSLAILATDVGAVNELVDDTNGWIIAPGNVTLLANTLREIAEMKTDELLAKQLKSKEKMADRFTWGRVAELTLKEIKDIISA